MEVWKEYKLKEICRKITDGSHSSPKAQSEGYPMFSVKDMLEYSFDYSKCKHISLEDFLSLKHNDCVPQKGDVLVAKDGSYLKQIFVCKETKEEGILSSIAIFRPNDIVDSYFLCYLLKSPDVFNYISNNCVSGSALPRIVLKDFKEVTLRVPSRKTQEGIVSILKSLDDKIEVNKQINENLEQQAQALFKSWFVDFEPFKDGEFVESELGMIPKGWRVSTIKNVATNITDGVHNTVIDDKNGCFYLLSCKNIKGGYISLGDKERTINEQTFIKLRKRTKLEKGDILLSSVGTIGEMVLLNEDLKNIEFQRSVAMIKPDYDIISPYFIYYSLANQKEEIIRSAHGAVQQCLFISDIANILTILPPLYVIIKFSDVVKVLVDKKSSNEKENKRLAELRDTLLPRLMSGELKVNEIEQSI